jgi:hypothetical protein
MMEEEVALPKSEVASLRVWPIPSTPTQTIEKAYSGFRNYSHPLTFHIFLCKQPEFKKD